jgi:hypothetical protein
MYGDERFMRLSPLLPSGQALWIYLLTGPHTGPIPGVFVVGRAALAETLGWDVEDFAKAFQEVIDEGLVEFDSKTRLCFIPNAIRHNAPQNPNVVKSWRTHWRLLPECELRHRVFEHVQGSLGMVSEAFAAAFEEACGKAFEKPAGKSSREDLAKQAAESSIQEEGEVAALSMAMPSTPRLPMCPFEDIADIYNETLPELPRATLLDTKGRKAKLKEFWCWVMTGTKTSGERRATSTEEALKYIRLYFERAKANDFVMGRTTRSSGHQTWRASLDYLISERGRVQIIEGTEVTS